MMLRANRMNDVIMLLRAAGGRVTSPRRAIVNALIAHDGHPSAEQITEAVRRAQPDVHESTVYRFLDELERLGVVHHVHLGHGPAVYHFTDEAHNHLVCRSCGKIIDVPDHMFDALRDRLHEEYDFDLEARHFAASGRCHDCVSEN